VTLQAVDSNSEVHDFLDYLFEGLEGWVYVPTKDTNGSFVQQYYQWPAQRDEAVTFIKEASGEKEVYVAPAIFSKPSGQKADFKATNVIWVDFDGNAPTEATGINSPSLIIQSSGTGHEHWYWRLTEPLSSVEAVESHTKWLAYEFDGDFGCWNANRVLRPPATRNHKRDKETFVKEQTSTSYSASSFPTTDITSVDDAEDPSSVIPDVADVILRYAWPKDAISLYRTQAPGDRSNALMALGYHCAEMGMGDAEIYSVVRNADDRWGKFKGRTDRHRRLLDLVARVRIKHPENEVVEDVYPVYGLRSLLETEIELEWVVPGLLEANGYLLLVGPSGVGKTQWSLRWAMNLAMGRNFLGFQIGDPQRILFVSCEMNHAGIKYFIEIMAKDFSDEELATLEENLMVAPIGEPLLLDTPDGQSILTGLLEYHQPDGLFFDSMGSATSGDLSQEGPVKQIMGYNDHLRNKYGIWTWYIHHQRKAQGDNKKPNKLSDVYGNQYLVNRATSVVLLWPAKDRIEVTDLKIRLAPQTEPWEIQRLNNLDFVKLETVKIVPKTLTYSPSPGVPVDLSEFEKPNEKVVPDVPPETNNLQGMM
jgi:hypothetical protein